MNKKLTSSTFRSNCTQTPLCAISMAPFPDNMAGQFQQCAGGQFDANHKKYAGLMANVVRGTGIVRLAWEPDGGSGHALGMRTTSNLAPFKSCFRRLAAIYRAAGLRVEWAVSKNCIFGDLLASYPGDDVVDFWGLHYYDSGNKPDREKPLARRREEPRQAHGCPGMGSVAARRQYRLRAEHVQFLQGERRQHRLRELLREPRRTTPAGADDRFPKAAALYK